MMGSYSKIYNMGHRALRDLFDGPVVVEEKVDGSQISFGRRNGELWARSRNCDLIIDTAGIVSQKMFQAGIDEIKKRAHLLHDGWTYRGEYLGGPRHNALTYDRVPAGHVALFDIDRGECDYLCPMDKAEQAMHLGFDFVPCLYHGEIREAGIERLVEMLNRISFLGGAKIEGVVVKNYALFDQDKKVLMGKHVSEGFKETHRNTWKQDNPGSKDIKQLLCEKYRHPVRWQKAIQHKLESGELQNAPQDIGPLVKEIQADVAAECADEIKEALWQWVRKDIARGCVAGFPEWYKERLLQSQFGDTDAGEASQ